MKAQPQKRNDGRIEGLGRALSQLITYPFETKKAYLQVGKAPLAFVQCYRGVLQSSATSGLVFGAYFNIYHLAHPNPLASSIAAFITSFLKTPIANSMRVMQINPSHKNFIQSGYKIVKKRGMQGLYNGYSISLLEDIIETSIRNLFYEYTKLSVSPNFSFMIGAMAGALGAAFTTPFDTIRTNMAEASIHTGRRNDLFHVTTELIASKEGAAALFRGVHLRATSNALRYAMFYLITEYLYASQNQKK